MPKLKFSYLLLFLITSFAHADMGEIYGFGSKASSTGNTMFGSTEESYTTYYNPALNSLKQGFRFSYGLSWAKYDFKGISNITVTNNSLSSDPGDVVGDVDTTSYLAHFNQGIGASFNFGEDFFIRNLAVGLVASLPVERVAYLDTGEAFKPEYFSYRSKTQRPQIFASLSFSPLSKLSLGAGLAFGNNLSGNVQVFATGSANSISSQRFATTIKPTVSPYFGALLDLKPVLLGLNVRLPSKDKIDLDTTARARLLGPTNDLPIRLNSLSTVLYDPTEITLAASSQFTEKLWSTFELSWYEYGSFEGPTVHVADAGSAFQIRPSISTTPPMRSIFVPKIGAEYKVSEATALRGGYFYRLSPVSDNSGSGNLVDPTKHVFTLGAGFDLNKAKWTYRSITVDLYAQFHWLVSKTITKTPGNEIGNSGQTKVGSPSYDIGGKIYGAGASVTMAF